MTRTLDTALCERHGIEGSIIQARIGSATTPECRTPGVVQPRPRNRSNTPPPHDSASETASAGSESAGI